MQRGLRFNEKKELAEMAPMDIDKGGGIANEKEKDYSQALTSVNIYTVIESNDIDDQ